MDLELELDEESTEISNDIGDLNILIYASRSGSQSSEPEDDAGEQRNKTCEHLSSRR